MEDNRTTETENYWLIQYQKLLDSRPKVRFFGNWVEIFLN
jgi:hypothetical protein